MIIDNTKRTTHFVIRYGTDFATHARSFGQGGARPDPDETFQTLNEVRYSRRCPKGNRPFNRF